jgi:hypothetical protein
MSAGGPSGVSRPPGSGAANPYQPPATSIEDGGAGLGPAEVGGYKSAMPLANGIALVMAFEVLLKLSAAVNAVLAIGVMQRIVGGERVARPALVAIDMRTRLMGVLTLVLLVAAVVLFCLFMPRANRNARAFGAPLANSPGWSAGWFFVPFASLYKPYYAMKEIWQASDPAGPPDSMNPPVTVLLPLWWWAFVTHNLGAWVHAQLMGGKSHGPAAFINACRFQLVASSISIVASVLAALVVRSLARRQERRAHAARRPPVTAGAAP